jgi:hypothetical protein
MPTNSNKILLLTIVVVLIVVAAIIAFVIYADNNQQELTSPTNTDQPNESVNQGRLTASKDGENDNILDDIEGSLDEETTIDNTDQKLNLLDQLDNLDSLDDDDFDDSDIDNF